LRAFLEKVIGGSDDSDVSGAGTTNGDDSRKDRVSNLEVMMVTVAATARMVALVVRMVDGMIVTARILVEKIGLVER
jgi:hypothetical protein